MEIAVLKPSKFKKQIKIK